MSCAHSLFPPDVTQSAWNKLKAQWTPHLPQHTNKCTAVSTKPHLSPLISQESSGEHVGTLHSSILLTVLRSQLKVAYENRPTLSTGRPCADLKYKILSLPLCYSHLGSQLRCLVLFTYYTKGNIKDPPFYSSLISCNICSKVAIFWGD